ncbi:Clan CA, family C1, cathepsin B-like cysteine peptidase [Trichomonas vaginalis G3]|uniref:Clan CA, family C1, cathepsin B-like cysteine peptidase n=1 Tax=Trichomonas vaginalis (strain ATCC PRA-98 / G3) TaxID=412133 RepID=A2GCC2_TRIV3|nr:cysteine-type peptidase protein [Trichomonas vaginalis G3]EAX85195.1 Clan CA, family C1, cathepsin B-like cysteine peptidase [Trichomonas vaginalis G3]KAI5542005.1 cysteine-type peptidase protein [Trichomonas vaginalis G3]|eukprot:XP_001298125.1 Clan CA, family C1, cathepsin B-like cysteine peptidase [Trichomonas vaginalis G3]
MNGIPNTTCHPFELNWTCVQNNCKKYKTQHNSHKFFYGEDEIKNEILQNGPVTAVFDVRPDLAYYKSGVYQSVLSEEESSFQHAVVIYGWGKEKETPFWWILNSYGPNWGINGSMKFLRGSNHCNIETHVSSALI